MIALFCLENMDYSAHAETALKQIADLGFVGSWQADLSAFGEEYAAVDLSMVIDENDHGVTTMNDAQTADFEAYAIDNGEKGDGTGLYVAFSNLEGEAEAAPYTMTVNETGQSVLTLTADDGTISWVKQADAETSGGETLDAWAHEGGWVSFSTFAGVKELNDAWEAGAAALGQAMGMELTGDMLKAMNTQVCSLPDNVAKLGIEGNTVKAYHGESEVFSHPYSYVETVENAIEGAPVYVYHTDDADAGNYAYICLTLPSVVSEEGGVINNFNLRCAAEDYASLFAEGYEGATGVLVWAETPIADVDYTLRLIYGAGNAAQE